MATKLFLIKKNIFAKILLNNSNNWTVAVVLLVEWLRLTLQDSNSNPTIGNL